MAQMSADKYYSRIRVLRARNGSSVSDICAHLRHLRKNPRNDGFTLIEMIVVLTVLSLMLLLIAGHGPPASRGLASRAAAGELAAGLREARSRAIGENRPVSLIVDLPGRRYRIGDRPPVALPPDLTVALFTVQSEVRNASEGGIRFEPDGSSTGGWIELGDARARLKIGVDWLTGGVSVTDAP